MILNKRRSKTENVLLKKTILMKTQTQGETATPAGGRGYIPAQRADGSFTVCVWSIHAAA